MSSISKHLSSMKAWVMAGKPYQSRLIPYEDEIFALRRRRPPMSYAQIAELLRQKYNFIIQRPAIFKFVKVRSRGRKEYVYSRNVGASATTPAPAAPQPAGLFQVDASGRAAHRIAPVQGGTPVKVFAVTLEVEAGVQQPEGPMVLASAK